MDLARPRFPQVLLIGNGFGKAFGEKSWDDLLKSVKTNECVSETTMLKLTEPLKAILLTEDRLDTVLKEVSATYVQKEYPQEEMALFCSLLDIGFDHILTTNYSYEIEKAAQDHRLTERELKKLTAHTNVGGRAEPKYLLHTFNRVKYESIDNKVWHIHGEARKPNSMILGHYYYGMLLGRYIKYLSDNGDKYAQAWKAGREINISSWLDAFILGDVYILGYGFAFSEFDLWWLLNRKKREKAPHGHTYFFSPSKANGFSERDELLRVLGAKTIDCGITKTSDVDYLSFYKTAIPVVAGMCRQAKEI